MYAIEIKKVILESTYLYITKSWSVAFNVATLQLSHLILHLIPFFFNPFFLYDFSLFFILKKLNIDHGQTCWCTLLRWLFISFSKKKKKKDYSSATNLLHILNHLNCYSYNMSYYLQLQLFTSFHPKLEFGRKTVSL